MKVIGTKIVQRRDEKFAKRVLKRAAAARSLHMRDSEQYPEPRSPSGVGVRLKTTSNPLTPSLSLLAKLGSIVVHVEEARSAYAHKFDWYSTEALLADQEVQEWIKAMGAYLPKKRS